MVSLLVSLWGHVGSRQRLYFCGLLALIILTSIAEVLSLGSLLPFLAVLTDPARVSNYSAAKLLINFAGVQTPSQMYAPLTIGFAVATLVAGGLRLALLWFSTRLSFDIGSQLGNKVYGNILNQSYEFHLDRNSGEIISGIATKSDVVVQSVIIPLVVSIGASGILLFILAALIYIDPIIAFAEFFGFGGLYFFLYSINRRRLLLNGDRISRGTAEVVAHLQEGLGAIRDILIGKHQVYYQNLYWAVDQSLRRAQASNIVISQSARYIIETIGMLLFAILAYMLADQKEGLKGAIPILGVFALGSQRMIPLLQQLYSGFANMRGGRASLEDILCLLNTPLQYRSDKKAVSLLPFKEKFSLENISFSYASNSVCVLKDISLIIKKGERVGFIGKTGSGKSTLLDLIMGLLHPTRGTLKVDDVEVSPANAYQWQSHIAHVPQDIFLVNATVAENIAFGVPKGRINYDDVVMAAEQAQISLVINTLPNGYDSLIGERGVALSGGQRQRLGIARALYQKADVIIFDEATSALDSETEDGVMKAIDGLSKGLTVLIIAHRLSSLKGCSRIVEIGEGGILRSGSFDQMIGI